MMKYPLRTRFAQEIIAEVVFPLRQTGKIMILCGGAPSMPNKRNVLHGLARRGFTVIFPRYRGTWESDGSFLEHSPHKDIIAIIDDLSHHRKIWDIFHQCWQMIKVRNIFLCGASFGGPAALLASRDARIKKSIVLSPVVDWKRTGPDESFEWFQKLTVEGFGQAYRGKVRNWQKLSRGNFYSPWKERDSLTGKKILLIHARDDRITPLDATKDLAQAIGARLIERKMGGHLSVQALLRPTLWKQAQAFLRKNK